MQLYGGKNALLYGAFSTGLVYARLRDRHFHITLRRELAQGVSQSGGHCQPPHYAPLYIQPQRSGHTWRNTLALRISVTRIPFGLIGCCGVIAREDSDTHFPLALGGCL